MTEGNIRFALEDSSCSAQSLEQDGEVENIVSQSAESQTSQHTTDVELDNEPSQPRSPFPQTVTNQTAGLHIQTQCQIEESSLPDKNSQKNPISVPRKRKAQTNYGGSIEEEFLRLEAKKVALLENRDDDDEDVNFFKSLLPHVRQLNSLSKLYFRSQVQNLLANEIHKAQTNQHISNVSFLQPLTHQPDVLSPTSTPSTCLSGPASPVDPLQTPHTYQQYNSQY